MADDAIEVEFQLTVDDMVALIFRAPLGVRMSWFSVLLRILFGGFVLGNFLILITQAAGPVVLALFMGAAIGGFIGLFLSLPFHRPLLVRKYKSLLRFGRNRFFFDPQKIAADSEAIRRFTPHSSLVVNWAIVESALKTPDYIFVYISTMNALMIPHRTFADEAAFERFYEKCVEYWNAAKGQDPAAEGAA